MSIASDTWHGRGSCANFRIQSKTFRVSCWAETQEPEKPISLGRSQVSRIQAVIGLTPVHSHPSFHALWLVEGYQHPGGFTNAHCSPCRLRDDTGIGKTISVGLISTREWITRVQIGMSWQEDGRCPIHVQERCHPWLPTPGSWCLRNGEASLRVLDSFHLIKAACDSPESAVLNMDIFCPTVNGFWEAFPGPRQRTAQNPSDQFSAWHVGRSG